MREREREREKWMSRWEKLGWKEDRIEWAVSIRIRQVSFDGMIGLIISKMNLDPRIIQGDGGVEIVLQFGRG